jgi:hypothetical protein
MVGVNQRALTLLIGVSIQSKGLFKRLQLTTSWEAWSAKDIKDLWLEQRPERWEHPGGSR